MSEIKRVAFIPLESNPDTFNSLALKLGLSPALSFTDVYSLTEESLLSFIPRPAHALILIYPTSDDPTKQNNHLYAEAKADGPVLYIKQTIKNACGLMALLHSVLNGAVAEKHLLPGSNLAALLEEAKPLDPYARAELLIKSPSLAAAHKEAAEAGETEAPDAEAEVDYHYIAFVRGTDGAVYEMDGSQKTGERKIVESSGEDLLASEDVRNAVGKIMQDTGSVHCGILALVEGA
ncbi:ubiquitinyl hydrolase 1 [Orbilia oligospora]|uniref:Ubiquitin carboxyl-terminal hydrolase n=1 Tax=Orbilia oligospora TaxID=2813651 RepID=A0A7C8KNE4_ORBOL|nr:ubiquitinyl hydrolase 1 [Orbilia oligospora]KAF3195122.1 ubiquitinyl hydrolase 1 [Orbilia oligospora]KAF3259477.1 ubiquitinyl hydrolase 1 [Orbilia oligospora]KAF3263959.1 ubiquitinyl hydrolase 1 [Orbilia oligospora]KAF3287782.1 ubiquitinyl hydrolase 1 [Orbilia oligospora]